MKVTFYYLPWKFNFCGKIFDYYLLFFHFCSRKTHIFPLKTLLPKHKHKFCLHAQKSEGISIWKRDMWVVKLYSLKALSSISSVSDVGGSCTFFVESVRLVFWLIFSSLLHLFWRFQILRLDLEKVFISEMVFPPPSPSIIGFSIFAIKWTAFSKEEL